MLIRIKRFFLALFGRLEETADPSPAEELQEEKPIIEDTVSEPEIIPEEETVYSPEKEEKSVCITCGSQLFEGDSFCQSCGESFNI